MTSRTHNLIAFTSLLTLAAFYPPTSLNLPTTIACLIGNIVGSLAPDLDQASNDLWDMLPAGNIVGKILRHLFLNHRTISHSILGIFVFYQIFSHLLPKILNPSFINTSYVLASLIIGFVSHIAADAFTKEAIPFLFPFTLKIGTPPFKKLRIKSGGFAEKYVIFPGVCLYLIWLICTKKEVLLNLLRLIKN